MLKKSLSAVIGIILIVAICVGTCTSAFAATSKQTYISDIVLCSANSADEAETKLKKQGYKLMSSENLNESLSDTGMYIGYKSTPNKSEAITDISAMNMNGKYSFSDYEVLMEQMKENVSATIDGLIPMITAYRTNYKAGATIATSVHDILNKFYEDDSKTYMGDYLLKCDLEDTTDITKVFMQGYSAFIVDIQQLLFMAGESSNDQKWIEKMAKSDEDYLLDTYIDSYPTPNKAYSALAADYGSFADTFRLTWNNFYENLSEVKDEYFTENDGNVEINETVLEENVNSANENVTEYTDDMSDDEFDSATEKNIDTQSVYDNVISATLIAYLDSLEYGDGTMLDFFMRDESEVDDTELYTLAYFMGNKLSAQVSNVGIEQVVSRIMIDGDEAKKDDLEDITNSLSGIDEVSIYESVDRSLFENGVALTSATTAKYVSSGKSWSDGLFSRAFQPELAGNFKWYDFLALYVLPTAISCIGYVAIQSTIVAAEKILDAGSRETVKAVVKTAEKATDLIYKERKFVDTNTISGYVSEKFLGKGTCVGASSFKFLYVLKTAFFILSIVTIIITATMAFVTLFKDNVAQTAEYSAIPNHIVDTVSTDNGDDYVAYNYVPNISGNAGDLNNYVGSVGWLTLYYTKDTTVGEPLTTSMKIVKGSTKAPLDYESVNMFGEKTALNLTSKDYTGSKDSANGTYMYFNRGETTTTGSIFSSGNMAIAVGVGAVIGIAVDTIFQKIKYKRKKVADINN